MAAKTPEQFVKGDIIMPAHRLLYTGSPVANVNNMGDGRTQVTFENGEIVEFFNGVLHEMTE